MANEETTQDTEHDTSPERGYLSLLYEGGIANEGALVLDEYAASLEGWRALFQLLGEIYFHSFPELRRVRGARLLRIEIVAERRGSWETFLVISLLTGIIGARADVTVMWAFSKLVEWYRLSITTFVRKKSETTDIDEIVAALREMAEKSGFVLDNDIGDEDPDQMVFYDEKPDEDEIPGTHPIGRAQALAERVDHLLKQATSPLEHSCNSMTLLAADKSPVLKFGPAERAAIMAPLTLPPPKREWRQARIKFERINRKTGRALFYFKGDDENRAAHYSRIIDSTVREPHNVYTEAFNDDKLLKVWIRQTHPQQGQLNFQWEITADDPDDSPLFNMPRP